MLIKVMDKKDIGVHGKGAGRKISARGRELDSILGDMKPGEDKKVLLTQSEREDFSRFVMRARTSAERLGMKVSVVACGDVAYGLLKVNE